MSNLTPQWDAVRRLQTKTINSSPLSLNEQIYDHAAGLALERLKHDAKYLVHNSYRHAKTTIIRQQGSGFSIHDTSTDIENTPSSDETLLDQEYNRRLLLKLIAFAERQGKKTSIVIKHWMLGFSVEESAIEINSSISSIKKIRQRFKAKARQLII